MDVVFLVDVTGSMGGAIASIRTGIAQIVNTIDCVSDGDFHLGLISYGDFVRVEVNLGQGGSVAANRAAFLAAVATGMPAQGGAGFAEVSDQALDAAINLIAAPGGCGTQVGSFTGPWRPGARKIIVQITDATPAGCDDAFASGVDGVFAHSLALAARAKGMLIAAVYVPTSGAPNPTVQGVMMDYASTTGGCYLETDRTGAGVAPAIDGCLRGCGGTCAIVDSMVVKAEIVGGAPTGCYLVEFTLTNLSARTAHYLLFPGGHVSPAAYILSPPLPPGGSTSILSPVSIKICGVPPGAPFPLSIVLMDIEGEECCRLTTEVMIPSADDCFQFDSPPIQFGDLGSPDFFWILPVTPMQFPMGHMFIAYEPPAGGPVYNVSITPDYFFFSTPIPQFGTATVTPFIDSNAPPGATLCFRIFVHHPDFDPCCSELHCATIATFPGPAITQPPVDATTCPGGSTTFSIEVSSATPVAYHWRKDGVPLAEGGCFAGTLTRVLTVGPALAETVGEYDCVVSSPEGSVTSSKATLEICLADLDCDGVMDFSDYLEFLNLYDQSSQVADLNGDGIVDFADYLVFLNHYEAGC